MSMKTCGNFGYICTCLFVFNLINVEMALFKLQDQMDSHLIVFKLVCNGVLKLKFYGIEI